MSDLTVTSGAQWRKRTRGGVVLTLPSGNVARVRSVSPDTVLRLGKIPDALTPIVADLMTGRIDETKGPSTYEELMGYTEFTNSVIAAALLEPRVVDDPQAEDEIAIDDIEWVDKEFLVALFGRTTQFLESFRQKQIGHVEPMDATAGHPDASEQDTEPAAVGEGN